MRVDTPATTTQAAKPNAPEAVLHAEAVAPAAATAPIDAIANAVAPAPAAPAGPVATEHDALINDVRAAVRACGDSFPALIDAKIFGSLPEGFGVPFAAAIQRAKDVGQKNPRDFVVGETAIELGMKRFGYQRVDKRFEKAAPNLLFTMLETVASARTMMARYPAIEPQIKQYITARWTASASATKDKSPALGAFFLSALNGALGRTSDIATKDINPKALEAITAGAEAFAALTTPLDSAALAKLEADPGEADTYAFTRLNHALQTFFPAFKTVLDLEVAAAAPKAEAANAAGRKLVSVEEAQKEHQERIARRERTEISVDERRENAAARCASELVDLTKRLSGHAEIAAVLQRPTPSAVRTAIAFAESRGSLRVSPDVLDRTIELALQTLGKRSQSRFGALEDRATNVPEYSAAYLKPLSGPDLADVLLAPIKPAGIEHLDGGFSDSRSRMYEAKSVPSKAGDAIRAAQNQRRDLDDALSMGQALAAHKGTTGEIGQLLVRLHTEGADAFDRYNRAFEEMSRAKTWRDKASDFQEAQAQFRGVIGRLKQVMALLKTLDDESGLTKLLRSGRAAGEKELAGAQRVIERQADARAYLANVLHTYGTATHKLRDVLDPRLKWFDTAVSNSAQSRQSDPLLPLIDGAWLGVVTAELRRAELTADAIDAFVRKLPPEQAALIAPEYVGGRDALARDLVEEASNSLAERLTGKSLASQTASAAAFESRALPALAARPRLAYLCDEAADSVALDFKEINEIQHYASVGLALTDNSNSYDVDAAIKGASLRVKEGRYDYALWSRMLDATTPSKVFLDALLDWRMYFSQDLARVVDQATTVDAATAKVEHIVAEALDPEKQKARETARIEQAKAERLMPSQVLENQAVYGEGQARLLAICDLTTARDLLRASEVATPLLSDGDATTRAVATYAIAAIANREPAAAASVVSKLVGLLADASPSIVQIAGDALTSILKLGSAKVAKQVVDHVRSSVSTDQNVLPLLDAIGKSLTIDDEVKVLAKREGERIRAYAREEGISVPRRVVTRRPEAKRKDVDASTLILSAARGGSDVDAIADRMKLALRLVNTFETWRKDVPAELRSSLEKLDFTDAIIDSAVAELAGTTPRGYLAETPELVAALLGSPALSAAEVNLLAHGKLSERLIALADHPLATSGQWRTVKLDSLVKTPDQLQAAITLKLELSKDLASFVGEIVAILISDTQSDIAHGAYRALVETLGHEIPLLNPALDDTQRAEAVANAKPLPKAIASIIERAVSDRLALVNAQSPQAAVLVSYLASGTKEAGDQRLTDAFENAKTLPQAKLLLDTMCARVSTRSSLSDAKDAWLVALLKIAPGASLEQLVAVRDSIHDARSDASTATQARTRVVTLAKMIFETRTDMAPAILSELLGVVSDAEGDRDRQSILDGMKDVVTAKAIPWTPSRAGELRRGLLMVGRNQSFGGGGRAIEQASNMVARLLQTRPALPDADMERVLAMVARCGSEVIRTRFTDAICRLYQSQPGDGLLSPQFLVDLDRWLASTEVSTAQQQDVQVHRESIYRGLQELMPIADATLAKIVDSAMGLTQQRTSELLRGCADHRRNNGMLTADDVERIVAKLAGEAPKEDEKEESGLAGLLGKALRKSSWVASKQPWDDSLEARMSDSDAHRRVKAELSRTLDSWTDAWAPNRRAGRVSADPLDMSRFTSTSSGTSGALGVFSARVREERENAGAEGIKAFTQFNFRQQLAGARQVSDVARARLLEGKTEVEQILAIERTTIRRFAGAFDAALGQVRKTNWTPAHEGQRLNVSMYTQQLIQKQAYNNRVAEAEREGRIYDGPGITPMPIFMKPVRNVGSERQVRVLFNVLLDYSQSTAPEYGNRIAYFKRLATILMAAVGQTTNIEGYCSLIPFSDRAYLLAAPARKHDDRAIVQALDPIRPDNGTMSHLAFDLAMTTAEQGQYDYVVDIMLTDGAPNKGYMESAISRVAMLRDKGHVVFGIGIGQDLEFMNAMFGSGQNQRILANDAQSVAGKMFSVLSAEVQRVIQS